MAKKASPIAKMEEAEVHDQTLQRGKGGKLHQTAEDGQPVLTTAQGAPVADDQNTLRVGARGPALIEDFHFREKIFHFDHERIPERVVHAPARPTDDQKRPSGGRRKTIPDVRTMPPTRSGRSTAAPPLQLR